MAKQIRVKICGITSVDDALFAASQGVDAIGLVFYPPSPRHLTLEQARDIALALGPFVTVVGLFVDAKPGRVHSVLQHVPIHLLQFHGTEDAGYCDGFHRPYIKAIRMREGIDLAQTIRAYPNASGILLDAYKPGQPGGTGEVFDWQRVPQQSSQQAHKPIILAGGLRPDNIRAAVQQTGVYGVDVSGGVEASPGVKDADKVAAFVRNTT